MVIDFSAISLDKLIPVLFRREKLMVPPSSGMISFFSPFHESCHSVSATADSGLIWIAPLKQRISVIPKVRWSLVLGPEESNCRSISSSFNVLGKIAPISPKV
jgi:hypothetical protein